MVNLDIKDNRIRKSLNYSFIDGVFATAMSGFTQDYFTPFLLILGGSIREVGALSALPNFFASLVQVYTPDFTYWLRSRKKMINIFVFLQAMVLLLIGIVGLRAKLTPWFFIFLVILFTSFGALATPAWSSLIADLVPQEKRGEYFGWRNRTLGFIGLGATFLAGYFLHLMKNFNIFLGFAIVFICAFLFRFTSWYFLRKMVEPPLEYKRELFFSLFDFLARIRESNFARFVLFVAMMNFSVNLASPFFVVLMIKELGFSYLKYTFIVITATLTMQLVMKRWGKHADRVGNLKVIKLVSPFIGLIPLLWVVNHHPLFLVFAQIFSGFIWAGFNLCTTNFIYDAVMPEKRVRCIAYFNVINGLAICLGALLGGFILKWLPTLFGYQILPIFVISSILRFFVGLYLPPKLKEVRPIEKVSSWQLFSSVIGIKPLLGIDRRTIRIE
ncbi:MAG: MFS transporter [Candidatus Omnitrophica bacterium]|nr:MFS transporter [Candidatus Omnitrophota bacterium]MCM8823154.1 MFS transporter [Candidatus Omnitrophota bacterium]MCM8826328.1 MFS transporter [Candidatus Omnitrophota bacterium]